MSEQFPIYEARLPSFGRVWAIRVRSWCSSKSRTCKKREAGGCRISKLETGRFPELGPTCRGLRRSRRRRVLRLHEGVGKFDAVVAAVPVVHRPRPAGPQPETAIR